LASKTNKTTLAFAVEETIGTLPTTPDWIDLERNDLTDFGATLTTTPRDPVNQNRMQEKGAITDLDSTVGFSTDLTYSAFDNFAQGFFYASWKEQTSFSPTAVTSTGYTVASGGDLTEGTLIYAKRFQDSSNNGLKVVGALSTSTEIKTTGLVAETSIPDGAVVEICGVQGISGDIELDSDGNLISTTLDFTALDSTITVGQSIWVGGFTTDTQFATAGYGGLARVRVVSANKITLDKRDWTVGAADDGTGKTIQILIGSFIRNVSQDDSDFLEETYTFEAKYEDLDAGNDTVYEYPNGCKPNEMSLSFPLGDKAGITFGFISLDTPVPTTSQESGNRLSVYDRKAYSTVSDCLRVNIYNSSTAAYTTNFKALDISVANGVSPEKILCTLGAVDMNIGKFIVTGTTQTLFTDETVLSAVRNNETISLDFAIENDDGVLHFDIPSGTLTTSTKSFPADESVLIDFDISTHRDEFFDFVFSCTKFPVPIGVLNE
jgi:hypothetical protein